MSEIEVKQRILAENDRLAALLQEDLTKKGIYAINIMGAPGAGKTSSIIQLTSRLPAVKFYIVEGDIESDLDTVKLRSLGLEALQINTGGACHLDAPVIDKAVRGMELSRPGVLLIENIGNLVCPAEFEIGEHVKMLVCSATEGSDKPYKYPLAFAEAGVILLTKCDLKEPVGFDTEFFLRGVRAQNREVPVFEVNAKDGAGFDTVAAWLQGRLL